MKAEAIRKGFFSSLRITLTLALPLLLSAVASAQLPKSGTNEPVTITAGSEWVALQPELEIEPGSALDFSQMSFVDAPAGKHGRVIAAPGGQFAFEDSPNVPRRFYGVNFCFGAQYINHEQADKVAERLVRLGYNAFRIHHYESILTEGQKPSTTLNPQRVEQFDYLMAALIKRGIYLTTDLFVSRRTPYRELGIDKDGEVPMDTFKVLVPVHPGAYANWKQFARNFLMHTNAYTGRAYAKEPALAWLAMINEGNFGNFFKDLRTIPEWIQAWNKWLEKRYGTREELAKAWGADLKETENPIQSSVNLPEKLWADGLRTRDCIVFLADTEREMVVGMRTFLRDELGCHALISNSSSWTRFTTDQGARQVYDYVDDHFYVDHPQFIERPWRLPSKSPNTSPIPEGATGGRPLSFTRLMDKPFTVTEYNYSGPGRFRGVGGILTGAVGALQGWGGIWRFAYSHSSENLFRPAPVGYFDMAADPLSQAAERASLCLFLRGDLQTATHSVGLVMTKDDLLHPPNRIQNLAPSWHWLAWVTRIGTQVVPDPKAGIKEDLVVPLAWHTSASAYDSVKVLDVNPYALDNARLVQALEEKGIVKGTAAPRPQDKYFRSETGEMTIDGPRGIMVLDTAGTAGGYAPAGATIEAEKSGVSIVIQDSDATVWVSALDSRPIKNSKRLLVTHLTDLQNTEIQYGEPERKTLLAWGRLPYLIRKGKAEVQFQCENPTNYKVFALSTGGHRLEEVKAELAKGVLKFSADVAANPNAGARMLYEVVRE